MPGGCGKRGKALLLLTAAVWAGARVHAQDAAAQTRPAVTPSQAAGLVAPQTQTQPRAARTPDERLWAEVTALAGPAPARATYAARLQAERRQADALLKKLRAYLAAYPGGQRRDEAVRMELATLHLLASRSGDFEPLCKAAKGYAEAPLSEAVEAEGAYWVVRCRLWAAAAAGAETQSASRSVADMSAAEWASWWEYVERYPQSRHAPAIIQRLFAEAQRRGDDGAQARCVTALEASHPESVALERMQAERRRAEAIGEPFVLQKFGLRGRVLDTTTWRGRGGVLVVWGSFDAEARRAAVAAGELAQRTGWGVGGVSVDLSADELRAALDELKLDYPQFYSGRGWAGEFVRRWAIRDVPTMFVVDRAGRLERILGPGTWEAGLAELGAD